ncbi:alpha/beta hydrolase [Kribbella sp. NBC_00382]|uniref:alpha/beta fold hydrolase n=1 Tax=Kribbella sp. NBC_00382 TaxID=2975967 RepID=UPI002E2100B9
MVLLSTTRLAGEPNAKDLLIVGPSLGTAIEALWQETATLLGSHFEVIGWDLPGHGRGNPATTAFDVADLVDAVRRIAVENAADRRCWYAGVSLGGTLAYEFSLRPEPFCGTIAIASGPRIGTPEAWLERASLVRHAGIEAVLAATPARWFASGFTERHPQAAQRLLHSLAATDPESYALACEALARFDATSSPAARLVGGRHASAPPPDSTNLIATRIPLLVLAGGLDPVVPASTSRAVTGTIAEAKFELLPDSAHLPPADNPGGVASAILRFAADTQREGSDTVRSIR